MKPIWKLVITIYLAAAALSAVSAGARHAYDAAETVRCADTAARIDLKHKLAAQNKAGSKNAENFAAYSTEELFAELIRRGLITWREVPPEKVDEVTYLLAKSESGSIDPLWCQARSVRDSKDAFYVPAWVMIGVSAVALMMALCLGLLYAVVRVVKLAWR